MFIATSDCDTASSSQHVHLAVFPVVQHIVIIIIIILIFLPAKKHMHAINNVSKLHLHCSTGETDSFWLQVFPVVSTCIHCIDYVSCNSQPFGLKSTLCFEHFFSAGTSPNVNASGNGKFRPLCACISLKYWMNDDSTVHSCCENLGKTIRFDLMVQMFEIRGVDETRTWF